MFATRWFYRFSNLEHETRDVIIVMHSYSGVPGSVAVKGLSKGERKADGKDTGVIGLIYIAALLAKGGDGKSIVKEALGGDYPNTSRMT